MGWMDAGLLAKGFQDLISSAFSSCQNSSLLRTEGGFFTLALLNCDAPRVLQRLLQPGKIIHRSSSCCRRPAATDQEGLVPGAAEEGLRLHLPLAAPAHALLASFPTRHAPGRILSRVLSSLRGAIIALTCSLGSHSAGFRDQTLGCFENDPD